MLPRACLALTRAAAIMALGLLAALADAERAGPNVRTPATPGPRPALRWDAALGVVLRTATAQIRFGGNDTTDAVKLRFMPSGAEFPLLNPALGPATPTSLMLRYRVAPAGLPALTVERALELRAAGPNSALLETFCITPAETLKTDLEVEVHFSVGSWSSRSVVRPGTLASAHATFPLKNGWAKTVPLAEGGAAAEYRLGHALTGKETPQLALPMAHITMPGNTLAVFTDPAFSTLLALHAGKDHLEGTLRHRYAASQVPVSRPETRSLGLWLPARADAAPFPAAVDDFFRLMLPEVAPGPRWLHDIAMVGYDFLSDDGLGWERDVRLLAGWLKPSERRRVALCLHGWYDALGAYCYDAAAGRMKEEWVAFARTRKVKFTRAELKRRLRLAHDLGFRVLLYFADGLAADSGVPGYRDDWAYRDAKGNRITGWQGPDTFGTTYLLNPAHPQVAHWFLGYLDALLKAYGADVDGVVWDETFHARTGQIAYQPEPAYADRAMFALVKALTARVEAFDPRKVFLASDCIGVAGWEDVPGYAMVADGTYQDSHCDPGAWSYGLFPNWRNTLWSCNWDDITGFHYTRWAVENLGVPVAISNGWGDDCGPSEWQAGQRERVLALFRARLKRRPPLRYLTADPAILLARSPDHAAASDPIPAPAPGEVNWALGAQGARATASSSEESPRGRWRPAGAVDGRRDDTGWGAGHGWASQAGHALPQWLEVALPQPRTLSRFIVITYQKDDSLDTAAKWSVTDYDIETWDERRQSWKRTVSEAAGRVAKVRVHSLREPVRTHRVRVVVKRVAPLDGQARLLQFEAWGPAKRD